MLTRVLAQELAPYHISVNEFIPGPGVTSATGTQATQRQGVFAIEGEWVKTPEKAARFHGAHAGAGRDTRGIAAASAIAAAACRRWQAT